MAFAVAALIATEPAVFHLATHFMAGGAPGHGEAGPGDHLQSGYRLWLAGHQLGHGGAPWLDPYSFQPEAGSRVNAAWWPFGLPYWPLDRLLGSVLAWNLFTLLCLFAAGACSRCSGCSSSTSRSSPPQPAGSRSRSRRTA